ncbi:hypothetical protein J7E96_13120 [Streptomyces sp. ISL-96]|uniref:hypothetical protein n=1 Tax=Streptomyces sp. ISL-96 TaxID=2819191 RepID=UPI001BEC9F2F|nr:hypothetical protein [Streptomyces sp. ISL-96]MBT2489444.1 hypothetical protein [Streptomyces sp. ISL-96]
MATDEAVPATEEGFTSVLGSANDAPSARDGTRRSGAQGAGGAGLGEATAHTFWWGCELCLDAEAAEDAAKVRELIGDVAGSILPSPFHEIVEGSAS